MSTESINDAIRTNDIINLNSILVEIPDTNFHLLIMHETISLAINTHNIEILDRILNLPVLIYL